MQPTTTVMYIRQVMMQVVMPLATAAQMVSAQERIIKSVMKDMPGSGAAALCSSLAQVRCETCMLSTVAHLTCAVHPLLLFASLCKTDLASLPS